MHFCNNSLNALFIFNFVNMAIRLKKISWYGMDKIYSLIEQLKWEVEKYKVELKCLKNQLNDRKSPVIFNNKDAILVNIEEIDLPNSPIEKGELSNLLCNVFSKKKEMDNSPFSRLFELVNEEYKNEYGHAKKEFFLSMINAIKNLMEVNIMDKDKEISQLKNVLRQMPGNIYWKDKNGVYLGVNKILIKTLKNCNPEAWHDLKEEDLIGKTDYDLFPQDIADLYRQNDCAVMAAKQDLCCEEKFTLPNGQTMLLLSLKGPLIDEQGNVIGIIGNTIDITDFKKIEAELTEAKEKAEANTQLKTAFIKSMEQDIRTSCDGIYTITNHLYEQEAESKKKAFLEHVIKASKELLEYCKRLQ